MRKQLCSCRVLMMTTPEKGAVACMLTNLGSDAGRKLCRCGADHSRASPKVHGIPNQLKRPQ